MTRHGWVESDEVARRLQEEASCAAARLGHRMTSWVTAQTEKRLYLARCVVCEDGALVSVRNPHRSPIAGAAVELRCLGKGKPVAGGPGGAPPSGAR